MRNFDVKTISAQDIVDTVQEGLIILDNHLTVVSANRCFRSMFAVTLDEVLGRRIYDLGNNQWNVPGLRKLLEEILPQERSVEAYEISHDFPGVGQKTIELNARKVYREGNHVEHILITFYDRTAQREEERKALRAAAVTREIVDTIRDPLVLLDSDLRITMASRNFVLMFGDPEADIVGRRIDELKQGQWNVAALRGLLERVVPDDAAFDNFLVEDEFPGLGHRVFKLNARKVYVPGNHVTNLLLAFEDATEAVAADRHKDVLAAELAHRIKNSLSVISSFVAFEMRRAAEPCLAGYQAMQSRISAVAKLYDVIARSSAFGPVDMPKYLNELASSIRYSMLGEGSDIEIAVEAEPLQVAADHAIPIGLLVNELSTNSVKYAFPGGRGRIVLSFRRRDGEVTLSVADNGSGMSGATGRTDSTPGMGARFIDAFVMQIGGTLARATGPTGTTVTVRLPATILAE